jgi:localization factor PodJL
MKSGGPWNLRGLRPQTREAAREAARRSGLSVGEWLNSVIQQDDTEYGEQMRFADYDEDDDEGYRPRHDYREPRRPRRRGREPDRDYAREVAIEREATLAREEFGEVHARLDRLTHQLERMAHSNAPRLTGAPAQPSRGRAPPPRPQGGMRPAARGNGVTVDDAVAEIAARQRALYGDTAAFEPLPNEPAPAPAPPPPPLPPRAPRMPEPQGDISGLGEQLRYITTRIEALRPTRDLEREIAAFRQDLVEISRQLTEALPRRDVESLESEVHTLAQRIDQSRGNGLDSGEVAGLERGLAEVRDALHGLTPAENLVGFDDAVRTLAQKVDLIIAKEDPASLQQLETAIGALRGIVSHVASNDTLNRVAEDVRALAAKVDDLTSYTASGHAVSMLEGRIDTLASALNASAEAGQSVPRELEKMLAGLIEKLEWVQLTHTDHAALGHLEDRIAQLIKRLDASDAKLGNLEAVERGLADLLVHIDEVRGGGVAEIKRSERRTLDSLEAVHGTVEQVVDRLAMIESGIHESPRETAHAATPRQAPAAKPAPEPAAATPAIPLSMPTPAPAMAPPAAREAPAAPAEPAPRRSGAPRKPIDPNLPPDHPLEPGTTAGSRAMPSAADRIAASEAAVGTAKPPVIADSGEKPNFIAAARRAAQAAATAEAAPDRKPRTEIEGADGGKSTPRLRKLLVAGGAVLILFGCVHIAMRMLQDPGSAVAPPPAQQAPPTVLPDTSSFQPVPQPSGPLVLPIPGAAPDPAPGMTPSATQNLGPNIGPNTVPDTAPVENPVAAPPAAPAAPAPPVTPAAPPALSRQSALHDPADITGSLPRRSPAPPPAIIAPAEAAGDNLAIEKLPASIGGPTLRAAALAGDATAEFEVATRFGEGHGVPPSSEQAARWLERAAKQGLALAEFRLGGFYEKGIGVKKDLAAARDLYTAAAGKGNGKAMHNLAVLYAEGINGPADYRTAAHWFRKAADYGITDSQYNLAILYARGIGVEQNYTESYKWFVLAANAGDTEAAKKRDEVASHLDAQSLAAAQAAIQKWTAVPQPDDAINVKTPPGGWDPPTQASKTKPRLSGSSKT